MSLKVLIVEDEPLIAADIEFTLIEAGHTVIGTAHTCLRAMDIINTRQPDIVLLDISIKGDKNGIDIGTNLKKDFNIPFIYITSFADKATLEMAKSTLPYGYIVKPFKDRDIVSAIEIAMFRFQTEQSPRFPKLESINTAISNHLTHREYELAKLIWEGKTNSTIAEELFLSINTIKTHLKNLFSKLDVSSRSEVIALLREI